MGWKPAAFAEIEPFPAAVLAHHFPNVPNLGDMTKFKEWNIGQIDLLVGGTPCQAFSVAGLRGGLSDTRGNLTLTFVEMADHFDPDWIVWENVPGVLSSQDNAFGCFLAGLVGASEPLIPDGRWDNAGVVSGPKRTAAWRVLDAQYFGVAQRRRRVFVCAVRGARNWAAAKAFVPVGESLCRDSPPRREAREDIAGTIAARFGVSRNNHEELAPVAARMVAFGEYVDDGTASAMKARDYKDATDLVAQPEMAVRRLTPTECERLQGFPDSWTNVPWRGKPEAPDGPRYKALGNSMAVPVMRWIGERIQLVQSNKI
jgi:DNA (cytosine-5)-methyltransferase 1